MNQWRCKIECAGGDIFVVIDNLKIAKRGQPNTPQARIWVSLEPGWTVRDDSESGEIIVEHNEVMVH